ncbi:hypothetical protein R1sor_014398 [Riccia sorocarpa]|uniref:Uncharacterized protein n=1 Tax=Riccia sorocarpa TaxID=122646 RepID=A0ABD3HD63_9MARC
MAFNFSRGPVDFLHRITKESLKLVLPFADFTLIQPELQISVVEPILSHVIRIMEPVHLAKILRVQACNASLQLRNSTVRNLWHLFGDGNIWKVPTEYDRNVWKVVPTEYDCSLTFTIQREVASFTMTAVAGVPTLYYYYQKSEWEISVSPRVSREQQSMASFEFGFIFRDSGTGFTEGLTSSLSTDCQSSAVRTGDDLKTAYVYSKGRKMSQWNLRDGNKFRFGTPLRVTLEYQGESTLFCSFSYKGDQTTFCMLYLSGKLFYPAVYLSNQSPFKPHYDQWTVKIEKFVGMDSGVGALRERKRRRLECPVYDYVLPGCEEQAEFQLLDVRLECPVYDYVLPGCEEQAEFQLLEEHHREIT